MKKPTIDLIEEHGGILFMLKIMTEIASRIKNKEEINPEHLRKIVDFVVTFADKCHHGKEEGILFPELLKRSSDPKLVYELLGEHKTGRDYIRGISESLEYFSTGNPDAYHIAINLQGYVHLLTEHIYKENTQLFPAADKILSSMQEEIEKRFELIERDVIGVGKHEEYHALLQKLREIYLHK